MNEFNIQKYLKLFSAHKIHCIVSALIIMTLAVVTSYLLPKRYESKSTVFIEKSIINELVKGIAITPSIDDKVKVLTYAITSRTLLVKVIEELDLNVKKNSEASLEELIRSIQENLSVKLKDKEGLFIISFRHKDPKIARDFVNTLIRRYIEENTSSKREDSYGASKFLTEQLAVFQQKLEKSESSVNEFKRKSGSLIGADPSIIQREINEAQQRIDDIRIRRSQLETILVNLRKGSPLQSKLSALQKRLADLQGQYTDSYPEVIQAKAEIDSVKAQMRMGRHDGAGAEVEEEKIQAEIRALRQAEDNHQRNITANRSLQRNIPSARSTLEELERERNSQKQLYEQLVTREGQSEVSKQMEVQDKSSNYRVIDPAVLPIKPASPDRVRIILIGIAAGIAGGIGLLLLLDTLDNSVKSVDVLKQFGYPVLAVIPRMINPLEVARQKRKDIKLYICSMVYFAGILAVLALEFLEIPLFDKILSRLV